MLRSLLPKRRVAQPGGTPREKAAWALVDGDSLPFADALARVRSDPWGQTAAARAARGWLQLLAMATLFPEVACRLGRQARPLGADPLHHTGSGIRYRVASDGAVVMQ